MICKWCYVYLWLSTLKIVICSKLKLTLKRDIYVSFILDGGKLRSRKGPYGLWREGVSSQKWHKSVIFFGSSCIMQLIISSSSTNLVEDDVSFISTRILSRMVLYLSIHIIEVEEMKAEVPKRAIWSLGEWVPS